MAPPGHPPALSPVLLAGLALRPLPPALIQPLIDRAMAGVGRRHASAFARLESLGDSAILIDPEDLPFDLLLRPGRTPPSLTLLRGGAGSGEATATIRGPLLSLVDLLEGRVDGDALFFTRQLCVEGNTEAVVALRNALDGADISLVESLAAVFGPVAGLARRVLTPADRLFRQANRDLARLQDALLAPVVGRCNTQAAELGELKDQVAALRRRQRHGGKAIRAGDRRRVNSG